MAAMEPKMRGRSEPWSISHLTMKDERKVVSFILLSISFKGDAVWVPTYQSTGFARGPG